MLAICKPKIQSHIIVVVMEEQDPFLQFFQEIPLPFKFVTFPYPGSKGEQRHQYLKLYINEVISVLILRSFNRAGFPQTSDKIVWNTSWGQQYDPPEYQACRSWQKINHFAGAYLLGRKDEFHMRMREAISRVGSFIDFYPESYLSSTELIPLIMNWKKYKVWIAKPFASSKGEGIFLVDSDKSLPPKDCVVQQYIKNPLLIGNKKFDVRLYILVTSISPVRIYLHEYGLVRFATHEYSDESPIDDLCTHLTNFSINSKEEGFKQCQGLQDLNDECSKWSLQHLYSYLESNGYDTNHLKSEFERISATCVLAGISKYRRVHQQLVPHRHTSYELYGIDILIDSSFKCWVMEVNISPSMSGSDSPLDQEIKSQIASEVLNLARIIDCDPENPTTASSLYDEEWKSSIISNSKKDAKAIWESPSFADIANVRDFIEEKSLLKRFKRIFPRKTNIDTYMKIFETPSYSDRSFIEWIKMSKEQRRECINQGKTVYLQSLLKIQNKL